MLPIAPPGMELPPGHVLALVGTAEEVARALRLFCSPDESEAQQQRLDSAFDHCVSAANSACEKGHSGKQATAISDVREGLQCAASLGTCCQPDAAAGGTNVISHNAAISTCDEVGSEQQQRLGKNVISNKAAMIEVVKQVSQIMEATSTFFKEKHKQEITCV